ncbi:uncharacterized protein BO96DRAFT_345419 [Aspergillus niger CBS 101883]|uniref:Uncharacterized protein n=2 Tax=Aspergillus niger TaxID=5061 RepID=A2QP85_ASPNC|nr:uncharacterized protein BO96DRAFT_345419 [Aspergillus niger CBS 101883]XP_059601056.1 hypothetical protein An07g08560 [Aspergillus niger]PYH53421.1 hypothetical protein BO96DRAFT_345419 [Aspergillus niger CBS 101883]CAK39650.1 hypothetical protein An07g08560 [Aspergillus niger]
MAVAGRQRVQYAKTKFDLPSTDEVVDETWMPEVVGKQAQHNLARTVLYDWGSGEPQPWYAVCFLTAGFLWVQVVFCQVLPVLPGRYQRVPVGSSVCLV